MLRGLHDRVVRRIDGAVLVRDAVGGPAAAGGAALPLPAHPPALVVAAGKAAAAMTEGWAAGRSPAETARALVVAPSAASVPPGACLLVADHPQPSRRSVAAARAVHRRIAALGPDDHLLVLLSGGGSALLAAPAEGLALEEKRRLVAAVARAGAPIAAINSVRKHLSAIKGGQLALATRARTTVLALSDVVGNDPATIASGPFSPDPTTFAEALEVVDRFAPGTGGAARERLARGAAGELPETPKPGDPRLAHVSYLILAGPERVAAEAHAAASAAGLATAVLSVNSEDPVPALASAYIERARRERAAGARGLVLVGNGEPRLVVTGRGRGGRATHLALLVARGIAGLPGLSFLAAGTDDRDGSAHACGAVVDGHTWPRALERGLDPEGALDRCDSAQVLDALGALVRGPGRSNLLDLHLLGFSAD